MEENGEELSEERRADREKLKGEDGTTDIDKIVALVLKIIFGFFLTIGSTFTAGMSSILPMEEKNVGLRHMMHLFGLNSWTYWIGMFIADMIIVLIPAVVCVMMLLVFDDIMER